ncbi:MAG TPA: dihydrodipicolinate synthase family protein [Clostridiales bacterium]|nr:dihydrodipicolinate synthase family protein [Clostridiales bacterium]
MNGQNALSKFREGIVIPAHPLALNKDRKLDEKRQRVLTRYYLHAGAGGLAVAVHTTQFAIRDPKVGLFEPVLRIAAEEMNAYEKKYRRPIFRIAGVCGPISQAVAEAETAQKLGYQAVLLSPGGMAYLSEEELIHRTKQVAEVLPVIGFYLQSSVGGRVLSYEYWQRICDIENVIGIKCASFNRYQTIDVVRAAALSDRSEEISLYTGNDDNIIIDLLTRYRFSKNGIVKEKGFVGGLLGHWAVWTHKAVEIFQKVKEEAVKQDVSAELLTLAAQITDANSAFFDAANNFKGCIAGIHEVLRRQGLMEGTWCIDKHETLSPGQAEEIDRVYQMYPHLNDDEFVQANIEKWLNLC